MAIAFVAKGESTIAGGSRTATVDCTGADFLVASIICQYADGVTAVTYNGVSMTLAVKEVDESQFNSTVYLYYLANPATGSNTLSVTVSGSPSTAVMGTALSGVASTGQPDATATLDQEAGSPSTATTTITTVADNSWIFCAAWSERLLSNNAVLVARDAFSSAQFYAGDSNGAITPAGSTNCVLNISAPTTNIPTIMAVASFAPDTGGGGGYRFVPQLKPFAGM